MKAINASENHVLEINDIYQVILEKFQYDRNFKT